MSTDNTVDYSFFTDNILESISTWLSAKLDETGRRAIPTPDIYSQFSGSFQNLDKSKFVRSFSALIKDGKLGGYEMKLGKGGGVGRSGPPMVKAPKTVPTTVAKPKADKPLGAQKVSDLSKQRLAEKLSTEKNNEVEAVNADAETVEDFDNVVLTIPVTEVETLAAKLKEVRQEAVATAPVDIAPPAVPQTTKNPLKDVENSGERSYLKLGNQTYDMPLSAKKAKDLLVYVFDLDEDPAGDIVLNGVHYTSEDPNVRKYLGSFIWMMIDGSTVTTVAEAPNRR